MADVPDRPGLVRRRALATYGRLPRRVRLALLHALAPSHTVGALCLLEHRADPEPADAHPDAGEVGAGRPPGAGPQSRFLLLRQHHRRGWTLPGGLVDRGEDVEHAVVREVHEETGLAIEAGLPFAVVVDPRARRVDVLFHVPVEQPSEVVAGSEATQAAWLTRHEAGELDEPTAQAFAMFDRSRSAQAYRGRLVERR